MIRKRWVADAAHLFFFARNGFARNRFARSQFVARAFGVEQKKEVPV
jgi:hypothetical protein